MGCALQEGGGTRWGREGGAAALSAVPFAHAPSPSSQLLGSIGLGGRCLGVGVPRNGGPRRGEGRRCGASGQAAPGRAAAPARVNGPLSPSPPGAGICRWIQFPGSGRGCRWVLRGPVTSEPGAGVSRSQEGPGEQWGLFPGDRAELAAGRQSARTPRPQRTGGGGAAGRGARPWQGLWEAGQPCTG